jgi:flagellar biosynthesis protein FlhF
VQPTSRPRTPTLGLDPAQLQRELDCLHAMLEELNAARPPRERALALLAAAGIEGALARQLAVGASRVARRGVPALVAWLMDRVSSVLCIDEDPLLAPGSQAIFCVGNTGVGKTTTLAKLAARARLDLGRSVAVISLDSFRVGAVEQWQRYASLMGIPLHTATTTEELSRRIAESRAEICLIDTTGKSSTTSDAWVALPERDELGQRSVRVLLVMPAWLRGRDAERTHEQYRDAGITGITISKLDETCQLGGVLQAAIPNRIPITYLCDGPRVPEDIQSARSELIVQALFSECT